MVARRRAARSWRSILARGVEGLFFSGGELGECLGEFIQEAGEFPEGFPAFWVDFGDELFFGVDLHGLRDFFAEVGGFAAEPSGILDLIEIVIDKVGEDVFGGVS